MKFVRFGSLTATDYGAPSEEFGEKKSFAEAIASFHTPPARLGIFAFIHPYTESFLWAWKVKWREGDTDESYQKRFKEYYQKQKKTFTYDGPIWTHLVPKVQGISKGSWNLVDSSELEELLRKAKHADVVSGTKALYLFDSRKKKQKLSKEGVERMLHTRDPYKRGLGGITSRDHLEVFIEKKHLNRIK